MVRLRDEIFAKYKAGGHVHAAMIELTHACPCDCEHCFLVRQPRDEMSTAEVIDLLEQLRALGVINLGLTGGEPFARRDLPAILEAAHADRFFTSILTTGYNVGSGEVDLLVRCGVKRAEVSLLGAEPETHDRIMRRPGAFDHMLAAVKLMSAAGLSVRLKSTLMQSNYRQLEAMNELATGLGVLFQANITVAPRVDGDCSPQALGLDERQLAGLNPALINGGLIPDEDFGEGGLLTCQAGRTVIGINPRGEVYPCLLYPAVLGNIRQNSLREILFEKPSTFLQEIRTLVPEDVAHCHACELRRHCQRCPGIAYMETGDPRARSETACVVARGLARHDRGD